jgi:uncharacterized protein
LRLVIDTNILVYAANRDSEEHRAAVGAIEELLLQHTPWALTWGIVYEFLRIATHARVFRRPLTAADAVSFLEPILESEVVTVLAPTNRHVAVMRATIAEFGKPSGNIFHDLHTAVLMREHGVTEIMTADTDFKKFSFLTVTNPVRS